MDIDDVIMEKYGSQLYYQAMNEPTWCISRTKIEADETGEKTVCFDVGYYDSKKIMIKINKDGLILSKSCTCDDYIENKICRHILACILKRKEDFFTDSELAEIKTENILSSFITKEEEHGLKEELELEFEIECIKNNFQVKLRVGGKQKYLIKSRDKFKQFRHAYLYGGDFILGKKLTYNRNKYFFSMENEKILEYLFDYSTININKYDVIDEPLNLSNREFKELLKLIKSNFKLNNITITSIGENLPTEYNLSYDNDTYKFFIKDFENYFVVDNNCNYAIYNHTLYLLNQNDSRILRELYENNMSELAFNNKQLDIFKKGILKKTINNINVDSNIKEIKVVKDKKISLYFDLTEDFITCKIILKYGDLEFNYFDNPTDIIRDTNFEQALIDDLIKYGFIRDKKVYTILDMDKTYTFIEDGLPYFSDRYTVYTTEKIKKLKIIKETTVKSNFSIGKDNILKYDFKIDNVDNSEVSNLLLAVKNKKKYYRLKSGDVLSLYNNDSLEEFSSLTTDLEIDNKDLKKKSITIPKYRAFFIENLKKNRYSDICTNNKFDEFINNFNTYKNALVEFSGEENKILRDYQKDGIKWLYSIYKCDLGGILADEMGLGKTLQAIIFIRKLLEEKSDAKILIVSPTSLVYNWENEFKKFAPELKYVVVAENKKKRLEIMNNFDNYNIFITTYGLVRNDNDEYENKDFEVCIIDEAQAIKNYQTGMSKEIKKIKARTKLALTGTPLENSVIELWSIFDFIMPGYLSSLLKFRENYGIKDVDEDSLKKLDNLNYQIRPFILRRKKKEVSKELPDKIEHIEYLDISKEEKIMYKALVDDTKEEIEKIVATEGFAKARFKILTLLTRLRQLCISPKLINEDYTEDSTKIKRIIEIIKELVKDNHKILIFSSFKSAISLLEKELDNESISNYVIDGSVSGKDRVKMVDAFNKDDTNCFLITLKSGGTGLNLTSADVVIHLDIWWNPQAENQATDRAHRIGQTKNVTVLKLINKGTVEERIVELQEKKRILSDNLIEGKNTTMLESLSEEELTNLLSIGYEKDKEPYEENDEF